MTLAPDGPAAFTAFEISRIEAASPLERRYQMARRMNAMGVGPTFNSLYDLVNCDPNQLVDGRVFQVPFVPDPTALEQFLVDLTAQFVAHAGDTGVHGAADSTNLPSNNGGADAFQPSDWVGLMTQLKAVLDAFDDHVVETGSSVHSAEDPASAVGLTITLATEGRDRVLAWQVAESIWTKYAQHLANADVHTVADTTNVLSTTPDLTATLALNAQYMWVADSEDNPADLYIVRHTAAPLAVPGRFRAVQSLDYRLVGVLPAPANVHAAYAGGSGAIDDSSGPWTLKVPARTLQAVGSAGMTDCVVTVTGENCAGEEIVERIWLTASATVVGHRAFAAITRVQTDVDPGVGESVTLQTSNGFGMGSPYGNCVDVAADGDSETIAGNYPEFGSVTPTTAPNGTVEFATKVRG